MKCCYYNCHDDKGWNIIIDWRWTTENEFWNVIRTTWACVGIWICGASAALVGTSREY